MSCRPTRRTTTFRNWGSACAKRYPVNAQFSAALLPPRSLLAGPLPGFFLVRWRQWVAALGPGAVLGCAMAIRPAASNCLLPTLVRERMGKSSHPCLGPLRVTCSHALGLDGRAILFQPKCKRPACQLHSRRLASIKPPMSAHHFV